MAAPNRVGRPVAFAAIVAFAVMLVVTNAITASWATPSGTDASRPAPLVEVDPCYSAVAPPSPPDTIAGTGTASVTIIIPAMAWVRVRDGHPVSATTNTGCFPRASDGFFVDDAVADPAVVAAVLACTPSGDWRHAGRWVDLRC